MERTKKPKAKVTNQPNQVKWVNHGGPFYHKDGRVIKRNETFLSTVEDIPVAFRDTIKPMDSIAAATVVIEHAPLMMQLKQREEDSDFYDIVDGAGKRLNEKDLTQEEAQDLLDNFMDTFKKNE